MQFGIDQQTIRDIELFTDSKESCSIASFFDETMTKGGQDFLYHLLRSPTTDLTLLENRRAIIAYFQNSALKLEIDSKEIGYIEDYLKLNKASLSSSIFNKVYNGITYFFDQNDGYCLIQKGIENLFSLFRKLRCYILASLELHIPEVLREQFEEIIKFFELAEYKNIFAKKMEKVSFIMLNRYDHSFRERHLDQIHKIVDMLYSFDAYQSIAGVASKENLCCPTYNQSCQPKIQIEGLFHPLLRDAIPYTICTNESSNLCFLTGSNMTGKSTFLKSISVAIYLAHIGFPIPATKMETTIFNGLVATINLADTSAVGYSHFFDEVIRVKETALKLKEKGRMFIAFDELFRGTNVNDALEASLWIIKSFANIRSSCFYISTHITEIENDLKINENNIYKCLNSELVDGESVCNHKLQKDFLYGGLELRIIKNEKIIELLNAIDN